MKRLNNVRVLMYSHDTFGLGHLRRCRAIAHALVEHFKGVSVLIISGSQIAGAFDFRARVDFVKIPSVIKLYNGDYTSIGEHIDIEDTLKMRRMIIQSTAEAFDPDIFIVDKEPLGLRGELESTLAQLKANGTILVLGLRDVMDSADRLEAEWRERDVLRKIGSYYDSIWVYGPQDFWDPLRDLDVAPGVRSRISHVGFLERDAPRENHLPHFDLPDNYILVTAGGGGDGADLMGMVLAARECDPKFDIPLVMVLGPFMKGETKEELHQRAEKLKNIVVIDFANVLETMMNNAGAVVGMCGYNTFCEILSFDKPTLFVPRQRPRQEQVIRARRAAELGLAQMLTPDEANDPERLARVLRDLPTMPRPSEARTPVSLNGLDAICGKVETYLADPAVPDLKVMGGNFSHGR